MENRNYTFNLININGDQYELNIMSWINETIAIDEQINDNGTDVIVKIAKQVMSDVTEEKFYGTLLECTNYINNFNITNL